MKTAVLYLRVSTDEQAARGYSLRSQQEVINAYCNLNSISISKVFTEDYSAKNFKRPEWIRLLAYLNKQKPDLLLFARWDRFSRNTCDAYQMINNLKKIGTSPQAVEQPLDLKVPENKLMLALYLASPEIENDRRGLNTKMGIRRAKKEGHWSGKAPMGYKNRCNEDGTKYIAPDEPGASAIRWSFNEIACNTFSMAEVYRKAKKIGLNCSINNFYSIIRNPIYCGQIRIRASDDEEEKFSKGLHIPLISEKLFHKVQNILAGEIKPRRLAIAAPDDLPLRGFLKCPNCHRMLTGSASKGRTIHVVYYHCKSPCKIRFNARQANERFFEELKLFKAKRNEQEMLMQNIIAKYSEFRKSISSERKNYNDQSSKLDDQIINARELLLTETIDSSDFKAIKADYLKKINGINMRMSMLEEALNEENNIQNLAQNALKALTNLPNLYKTASIEAKRYIVQTIFLDVLIYNGNGYRTTNLNSVAELIYLKNNELRINKKGEKALQKNLFPVKGK
jgi:site-specific DNA recombinase